MGERAATALARLRVCRAAGLPIPADLHDEVIECLAGIAGHAQLKAKRDALIRRAAMALPPAGSYRHAEILAAEAKAMTRVPRPVSGVILPMEPVTPRECLFVASLALELPSSVRQYYRVLKNGLTDTRAH